jgi:hypothetical protein
VQKTGFDFELAVAPRVRCMEEGRVGDVGVPVGQTGVGSRTHRIQRRFHGCIPRGRAKWVQFSAANGPRPSPRKWGSINEQKDENRCIGCDPSFPSSRSAPIVDLVDPAASIARPALPRGRPLIGGGMPMASAAATEQPCTAQNTEPCEVVIDGACQHPRVGVWISGLRSRQVVGCGDCVRVHFPPPSSPGILRLDILALGRSSTPIHKWTLRAANFAYTRDFISS